MIQSVLRISKAGCTEKAVNIDGVSREVEGGWIAQRHRYEDMDELEPSSEAVYSIYNQTP